MIPTSGVYPIATANDKSQISAPLMSRFAVIDIPDYTPEEKKVIFSKFALPKILKRMSLKESECIVSPEALDTIIEKFSDTTGIRESGAGCRAYRSKCTISNRGKSCILCYI